MHITKMGYQSSPWQLCGATLAVAFLSAAPAPCRGDLLYVSCTGNSTIETFDLAKGVYLGVFANIYARGLALDGAGNLCAAAGQQIIKFTPNGVGTAFAAGDLGTPTALAFDRTGNLYVADMGAYYAGAGVTKFTPDGVGTRFAALDSLDYPQGLAVDSTGNIYVSLENYDTILKFTPDGLSSSFAATAVPIGMAFDGLGNLYVANNGSSQITKFTPGGAGTVFASGYFMEIPMDLAFDSAGNVYVAGYSTGNGRITRFAPDGSPHIFADVPFLSNPVYIAIRPVPEGPVFIALHPQDQAAPMGSTTTFAVSAVGTPPLSYQWQFNGTNMTGATAASLTLTKLQKSQAGNYSAVVSNSYGAVVSSNALLTVLTPPPTITSGPHGQNLIAGRDAGFSVVASGSGPLSYQWRHNGVDIPGAVDSTLSLVNVALSDAGTYTVIVSNPDGSSTKAAAILNVVVDRIKPVLTITAPKSSQQWGYASVPIKGWARDNARITIVRYRLETGPWLEAAGTTVWSGNLDGLAPGRTNTLSAYAQDPSGNCSRTSVVKVVYNQFLPVNGAYHGLFAAADLVSNRLHESSGFLKLTVSGKGSYSGYFLLAGKTYSLGTGRFDVDGHASKNLGFGANLIAVNLDLSLALGSDYLIGTLSNSAWTAVLHADRAVFATTNRAPYAGKYTLIFPGTLDENDATTPFGAGYAAVTVDSLGKVLLSGSLADGTPISQGTRVSKDGRWPMYAGLHGSKGSVWGWLQLTNNPPPDLLGGEVSWIKHAQPATARYYPLGFTNALETEGSRYVAPSNATTRVPGFTNGVVSFAGGNLAASFANPVRLTNHSLAINQGTNKLTMSVGVANGKFSGTVVVPGTTTSRSFKGAVLQDENVGWGYFLGTNQSGSVLFEGR